MLYADGETPVPSSTKRFGNHEDRRKGCAGFHPWWRWLLEYLEIALNP